MGAERRGVGEARVGGEAVAADRGEKSAMLRGVYGRMQAKPSAVATARCPAAIERLKPIGPSAGSKV